MRSSILVVASCLGLLFAWEWAAVAASSRTDPLVLTGEYFELRSHVLDEDAARQGLDIVEAAWPIAMGLYGIESSPPEQPLRIHLYRDPAGYESAEANLTQGKFKRNLAFAHWDTKTAHVALQPQLPDKIVGDLGLNFQTLRLLVHEASHLARFHVLPNYRSHPGWFADGNASWIETLVLRQNGRFTTAEQDPSFATDTLRVQRLAEHGKLPPMANILHDRVGELEFYEVYAVRWLLFRFLMEEERREALRGTIADMRRFGGGGDFVRRVAKALMKRLGDKDFAKLDSDFRVWIARLEPRWDEVFPSLETHGADWLQTAFDEVNAVTWCTEPARTGPFELTGSVEILLDGRSQLNVLLGRDDTGFVSVAFTPARVDILEYSTADETWTTLADATAARMRIGEPVPFRIHWLPGRELSVDLDDEQVLECDVSRSLTGPWGLSAQAGSTGIWRDVALNSP